MELRTFARLLRRGWVFIVACVVIGGAIGVVLTITTKTTYQSTAKVFVASNAGADNTSLAAGNTFTQDRTAAYVIFAKSPQVTNQVIGYLTKVKNEKLDLTPQELAQKINATVEDNKVVIDIAVTDGNPIQAQLLAQTVSTFFIKAVVDNEQTQGAPQTSPPPSPTTATTSAGASSSAAASPTGSVSGTPSGTPAGSTSGSPAGSGAPPASGSAPATPSATPTPTDWTTVYPSTSNITNSVVKLTQAYPANLPVNPVAPKPTLNIALGVLIGLLLSLGIIILRDVLDNTMKGPTDFEKLGVPVLGTVPFDRRAARTPVAFRGDLHSARSEAYRAIRTNMQFVDVDNPPHLIAVTSAMPGEGKTTTAINLASALAEAGYRVCLIDADLRRPSVAKTLGLVGDVGFTSVLISDTPVEDVLQNAGRNLAVLTSGPVPPNPSELLITDHARSVITEIADKVDYCVIDTPPLLPVTDGAELSTIADATLIIARARKTTEDQTKRAIEALAKVGQKPVGVIINMISGSSTSDYEAGYYYAPYRPERRAERRAKADDNGSTPTETTEAADASTATAGSADEAPPVETADASAPTASHAAPEGDAAETVEDAETAHSGR